MKDFVHNLYDYESKAETKEEELEEEQDDEIWYMFFFQTILKI